MDTQNCVTTPVTPRCTTVRWMLHKPAPQIISLPVTSVIAGGLPLNCTSKFTNLIFIYCLTNRTFSVCLSRW